MLKAEAELWARYQQYNDLDARRRLLDQHLGLVHHIARQIAERVPDGVELDDLVSAGALGLVLALESFEPERGLAFSTYATPRIRGSILDDLRSRDWVPRSVRSKSRRNCAVASVSGVCWSSRYALPSSASTSAACFANRFRFAGESGST